MIQLIRNQIQIRDGPPAIFAGGLTWTLQAFGCRRENYAIPAQLTAMILELKDGGNLPRIRINRDTDGTLQLEDGHHRLVAYWLSGREELSPDEYLLLEKDQWRARFGKINDLLDRCGID